MPEQRTSRRFKLNLPLELNRLSSPTEIFRGETVNISSSGLLFTSDASLSVGDVIECRVAWPVDASVTLRCIGKVIRASRRTFAITVERHEFSRPPLAAAAAASSSS